MSLERTVEQKNRLALVATVLALISIAGAWALLEIDQYTNIDENTAATVAEYADTAAIFSSVLVGIASLAFVGDLLSNVSPRPKQFKLGTT